MKYRYKRSPEGTVEKRKARCNLRGDKMKPYIHYNPEKTSSYNADLSTIRLLMAIAATHNLHTTHLDIESAYLHEKYSHSERVYVKQPTRFNGTLKHKGCTAGLLLGNIYGSKNSGNTYLNAALSFLKCKDYNQSKAHPCLFYKIMDSKFIIFTVTTDDFYIISNERAMIQTLESQLSTKYRIKNLGEPRSYIGWTIHRFNDGSILINQPDHIAKILNKMRMTEANGKHTPYNDGQKLHRPTSEDIQIPTDTEIYQSILSDLRYIADSIRPDIHFIVGRLASDAKCPTRRYWNALKALVGYLKHTQNHGIHYAADTTATYHSKQSANPTRPTLDEIKRSYFTAYSDANHASDVTDRRSIAGTVHLYNQSTISWQSQKQSLRAMPRCEAEYIAATTATQHTQWIRRLFQEIHILPSTPTTHYIDNQSAIQIAKSAGPTKCRKYIDLRHHYLRDHVNKEHIDVKHVRSNEMLADMLTKPLKRGAYTTITRKLHITTPNQPVIPEKSHKRPPRDRGSETIPVNKHCRSVSFSSTIDIIP